MRIVQEILGARGLWAAVVARMDVTYLGKAAVAAGPVRLTRAQAEMLRALVVSAGVVGTAEADRAVPASLIVITLPEFLSREGPGPPVT